MAQAGVRLCAVELPFAATTYKHFRTSTNSRAGKAVLFRVGALSQLRRNLPHVFPEHVPIFFTWRLFGPVPATSASPSADLSETHAERFLRVDRLLDTRATGPKWRKIPRVAMALAENSTGREPVPSLRADGVRRHAQRCSLAHSPIR